MFARSANDREETHASTEKEFQHKKSRKTTAGVLAFVYNCGIILDVTELYGAESTSQVGA